ncbi:MAG: hypothetical protein RLZ12_451 [Bacillota bacterium]|jgi:glycyl-tRNA synthetase beta chain
MLMFKDLLIELLCEELPARFIPLLENSLQEQLLKWLAEQRITYGEFTLFSTPRRVAILVSNVADCQGESIELVRGPALKAAQQDGVWTKAGQAFAAKVGCTADDLIIKSYKERSYVYANVRQASKSTRELLTQGIPTILSSIHLAHVMHWGEEEQGFVRPVRGLIVLYGGEVVKTKWAGVTARRSTIGHRFLSTKEIVLEHPSHYCKQLKEQYVIPSATERRRIVLEQLAAAEKEHNFTIPCDEELLNEVVNLVEYPTVLMGSFEPEYLALPKDVLVTFMRAHQRYFHVEDNDGHLLPKFLFVSNGGCPERVVEGNECVLRARVRDAAFFYNEDKKVSITQRKQMLNQIVFQDGLGSLADKCKRLVKVCSAVGKHFGLTLEEQEYLLQAAESCKFARSTLLVGEFTELESKLSAVYAEHAGLHPLVAKIIFDHYCPETPTAQLPSTELGAILAVVDRCDTLAANFGIGYRPTGSLDPYALRRAGGALVRVLTNTNWTSKQIAFLMEQVLLTLEEAGLLQVDRQAVTAELYDFLALRFKKLLGSEDIPLDVAEAVLAAGIDFSSMALAKARILAEQKKEASFIRNCQAFVRVTNLAKESMVEGVVQEELLSLVFEKELYQQLCAAQVEFLAKQEELAAEEMYAALGRLAPFIEAFFDNVLVKVEEQVVQDNRLALLAEIAKLCHAYAEFKLLSF